MNSTTRRHLRARRPVEQGPLAAPAAPAAPPAAVAADAMCRICWQEQDAGAGGQLLSPCRCSGSQQFVHHRCLAAWIRSVAERKGVPAARRCDVCRAPYMGLPRELRPRESALRFLRRHAAGALDSPLGLVASYYAAGSIAFSVGVALWSAWHRLAELPALLRVARRRPGEAARRLGPDLLMSLLAETCLSGQWTLPLASAARLVQGLTVQQVASWAQELAVHALPPLLLPLAMAACGVAELVGQAMQFTHAGLLLLFGGLTRGFVRGAIVAASAPARGLSAASRAGCQAAAGLAALLVRLPRGLARRRQRRQGRSERQAVTEGHSGKQQPGGRAEAQQRGEVLATGEEGQPPVAPP